MAFADVTDGVGGASGSEGAAASASSSSSAGAAAAARRRAAGSKRRDASASRSLARTGRARWKASRCIRMSARSDRRSSWRAAVDDASTIARSVRSAAAWWSAASPFSAPPSIDVASESSSAPSSPSSSSSAAAVAVSSAVISDGSRFAFSAPTSIIASLQSTASCSAAAVRMRAPRPSELRTARSLRSSEPSKWARRTAAASSGRAWRTAASAALSGGRACSGASGGLAPISWAAREATAAERCMRRRSCAASRTVVGSRGMMARSSDRAWVPASTAAAAATASPTSSAATEATVARAWRRGTCGANAHISAGDSRATSAETTEGVSCSRRGEMTPPAGASCSAERIRSWRVRG